MGAYYGTSLFWIFVLPAIVRPVQIPEGAVWHEITVPFVGVGSLLPDLFKGAVQESRVIELASVFGFDRAEKWMFMQYACWAERIYSVFWLGFVDGEIFFKLEISFLNKAKADYVALMEKIGVTEGDTLNFQPLVVGLFFCYYD